MKRIYVNTAGPGDWRARLADPERHWKPGRSAFELAVSWEAARTARGLPREVAAALDTVEALEGAALLFAIPEHSVPMPGRGKGSQTDLWGLLRGPQGLISLAVEGKAGEPFGSTIAEWRTSNPGANREARLLGLCHLLQLSDTPDAVPSGLRYQLFHRTASALLEAKRCGASHAVVLVQSFDEDSAGLADFQAFASYLGCTIVPGVISPAQTIDNITLWFGWIACKTATTEQIARTIV